MQMKHIYLFIHGLFITALFLGGCPVYGQEENENIDSLVNVYLKEDSTLLDQLERALTSDSLSLSDLFDSLVNMDLSLSQLSFRLGYNSNVVNAGRNFGIVQHGFNAGISYYHKTGLFADVSGYWNSDITPHYSPTITTLGYMGDISKSWTYTLSYDHYFYQYHDDDEFAYSYPLTNAINASTYFDIRFLTLVADYSFMFGDMTAHRLRGSLMFNIRFKDVWFTDGISLIPTISLFAGSQKIYHLYPNYKASYKASMEEIRDIIGVKKFRYLWMNNRKALFRMASAIVEENMVFDEETENTFGIMNYSLSVPAYIYVKHFTFLFYYTFNIPVALPGEDLQLDPNSFFGTTLIYNIPFFKFK